MTGVGGFGYGFGGNPRVRAMRMGVILVVLLASVVFGHGGGGGAAVRLLSPLLVVGLLWYSMAARSRRRGPFADRASVNDEVARPRFGGFPTPPRQGPIDVPIARPASDQPPGDAAD